MSRPVHEAESWIGRTSKHKLQIENRSSDLDGNNGKVCVNEMRIENAEEPKSSEEANGNGSGESSGIRFADHADHISETADNDRDCYSGSPVFAI